MLPALPPPIIERQRHDDPVADDAQTASTGLLARLRTGGLRITAVRTAMLAAMIRRPAPITLRQLQVEVGSGSVAFATLFRCMRRFEEIGLVRRTIEPDGATHWELNLGGPQEFHVTSRNTGQVTEVDPESSAELRSLIEKIDHRLRECGYTDLQLNVTFHGVRNGSLISHSEKTSHQQVA